MEDITIIQPDDFHHHLRDGEILKMTVSKAAEKFGKLVVMPNLIPPVVNVEMATKYKERIETCMNDRGYNDNLETNKFNPLMTLYLTNETTEEIIKQVSETDWIIGFKYYPKHATTNSKYGISYMFDIGEQLSAMEKYNVPLLIHGETTNPETDIFDKEDVFIETIMYRLIKEYPNLKITLEHITTSKAVEFVLNAGDNVGATITPHHLWLNRNDIFKNGINPHYYCLPILKRQRDQKRLIEVATSGNPKFFLGTDSAPHYENKKLSSCGCAGIYNSPVAIELCATIFENENALDKLEAFTSINGAKFYGYNINSKKIRLVKENWKMQDKYYVDFNNKNSSIVPLMSGKIVEWKIFNN